MSTRPRRSEEPLPAVNADVNAAGSPSAAADDEVVSILSRDLAGRLGPAFVARVVAAQRAALPEASRDELLTRCWRVLLDWLRGGDYSLPTPAPPPTTTDVPAERSTTMTTSQPEDRTKSLTDEECWALLRRNALGRIGFDMGHGNRIYPVNYAVDDGSLLVRTGHGTELGRCVELFEDGTIVAFEVDHIDTQRRRGWSVLVQGSIKQVTAQELAVLPPQASPHAWVVEPEPLLVRIRPVQVTGRRIGGDW